MNSLVPMTFDAPGVSSANGHYSHGAVHGGLVFTAIQLPIDPAMPTRPPGAFDEQVRQVLTNLGKILEAGGSSLSTTVRITINLSDIALWSAANHIYAEMMGNHRPPRGTIAVPALHLGYHVAMDAIGAVTISAADSL